MLIDTDDLVSVTELARNLSRYVAHASQDGRRVVIMNNNVPTAAIVGMGDLQRLIALEHTSFPSSAESPGSGADPAQDRPRPALPDLARTSGTAALGCTLDGTPLTWKLSQHHLLVGQRTSGRDSALSAAIATATADPEVPVDLVVATTRPALSMEHAICGDVPIAVHPGIDDRSNRAVFIEILEAEIADRTALLTESRTVSISDYRATGGTPIADLVIVLDGIDELAAADRDESLTSLLSKLLTDRGDSLGIWVWLSVTNGQWLGAIAADIADRCAVRTRTGVDSRLAVATDAAKDLDPGQILHYDSSAALARGLIAAPDLEHRVALAPSEKPMTTWSLRLNAPVYLDDIEQGVPPSGETTGLQLAIGIADTPRRPLLVQLGPGRNHLFFAGDPGSGLSTAVFTLIVTAAATYPPGICAFHVLDCNADANLEPLSALPNVGAYANAKNRDMRARILGEYERILDLRANRRDGSVSRTGSDPYQRMILVIDNAAELFDAVDDVDDLKDRLRRLMKTGPQYGLHVLMAGEPGRIPVKLLTEMPATLVFSLTDPSRALLGVRNVGTLVRAIPTGQPGRCVEPALRTAARVALPYPDPSKNTDRHSAPDPAADPAADRRRTVELILREYGEGQQLPQLHTVPDIVPLMQAWESFAVHMSHDPSEDGGLRPASLIEPLVGVDVQDWSLVAVPRYAECGHLLIAGDPGSGKTATLRTLIASLAGRFTADNDTGGATARFAIIDQSMELIDVADRLGDRGMLLGYGTDRESATRMLDEVATMITPRIPAPGAGLTVEQIRDRTWYSGPEVFVVIDNASILFGQGFGLSSDPKLDAVLDLVSRNGLGLHVFATMPAAGFGAVRMGHKLVRALESAGAPTLMLSGHPAEGVIWPGTGIRFQSRRPGCGSLVDGYSRNRIVQVPWLEPGAGDWPSASVE